MALVRKTYNRVLVALLSWLGFSTIVSSCTDYGCPCVEGEIQPEYSGSTVSKTDQAPISGIRVVLKGEYMGYDTAYTAKNGDFVLQYPSTYCKEDDFAFQLEFHDVDGEANGSYEDMEITVASSQNLGTIEMTPKE